MPKPRQAFEKDKLVVLPEGVILEAQKNPLLQSFLPVAAGYYPESSGHFVERTKPLPEAIVMFCTSGRGWVKTQNFKQETVNADSLVFLPPGIPHSYGASESDPWTIHWAHIRGTEVEAFRNLLQVSPQSPVLPLPPGASQQIDFDAVHRLLADDYSTPNLLSAAAQLRLILTLIHRTSLRYPLADDNDPIERTIRWMRGNLRAKADLSQLAKRANFSVPHYSSRFKTKTGFSPVDYFLRMKIQHACRLLDVTQYSIERIATEVGYEDPFYFSRLFRRIMNKSPREYRSTPKG